MEQLAIKQTMPKEMKAKWLEALRSGKYPQGRDTLFDGYGYCCLGVLQVAIDGTVEKGDDGSVLSYPTKYWCREKGVPLSHNHRVYAGAPEILERLDPPLEIDGYLTCASEHNDAGHSFDKIADAIEEQIEGV